MKNEEYNVIKIVLLILVIGVSGWLIVNNSRDFGLTGGPTICNSNTDPYIKINKPKTTDTINLDSPYTYKWSTCNTAKPYTITITKPDGNTFTLGSTDQRSYTATLDSGVYKNGSYSISVSSADGISSPNSSFSISSPYPNRYYNEVFSSYTTTSDIVYSQSINKDGVLADQKLDLYQPTGDTSKSRAAIVFVHGGSFTGGDKDMGSNTELFAKTFALRGYVTVSVNYRLWEKDKKKGYVLQTNQDKSMYDVQAAVRWLRANASTYNIDTNRIAIGGSSAGAGISNGVTYSADKKGQGDNTANSTYSSAVTSNMSFKGYITNLTDVTVGEAPLLDIIGSEDDFYSAAEDLYNAVTGVGSYALWYPIAGGTHNSIGWDNTLQYSVPFYCKWNAGFCTSDAQDPNIVTTVTGTGSDE